MTVRPASHGIARRTIGRVVATAALLTGCGAELPTSAELEGMDVAAAERRLGALTSNPTSVTYMLNGKEISAEEARALSAVNIASLDVSRLDGKRNMISIRTSAATSTNPATAVAERIVVTVRPDGGSDTTRRITMSSAGAPSKPFEGLIFIDGVKSSSAAMNALGPNKIAGVEVIKGTAAETLYGPEGAKGVIKITTRK